MGRSICRCGTMTGAFLEVDPEIKHVGARVGEDREETEPAVTIEGLQAALDCALELYLAAKNEEKRQAELWKRAQYQSKQPKKPSELPSSTPPPKVAPGIRKCYGRGKTEHLARDCKEPKRES